MKPLSDFGLGRTTFFEGGVGLFLATGAALSATVIAWATGARLNSGDRGYQAVFEFPLACGITVGTPVRIRGVQVGQVLSVKPSLERVDVLVEVNDSRSVIPRNALIQANQSGLIAEPLVDVTPQLPVPPYTALPTDPACEDEEALVCHRGRIQGEPGVALDDLVYIMTKLARQADADGMDRMYDAAESATAAIEEARPLLRRAVELSDEVVPLLQELRQGTLLSSIESLTATAASAAADIHALQRDVLTKDNVGSLKESVQTLTKTLQHIEGITGDMAGLTGDRGVQSNLKQLIEALSRLISD
ncbi:unnamed protein product [Pedinophyceae sp. YPF-701]|nr:unnamed protein product [Pedinophyceae sp. YPF-701]